MRQISGTRCRIRWKPFMLFLFIVTVSLLILYYNMQNYMRTNSRNKTKSKYTKETMHLVIVSCGRENYQGVKDIVKPLDLSLTNLKSAAMFAKRPLHIHVFTEDVMSPYFKEEVSSWPFIFKLRVKLSFYSINYSDYLPEELINEWKSWYKPCGSFRLLLPMILKDITDAAIYTDNDVIFVKPIDELWDHLKLMQQRHVAGISPTAGHPIATQKSNVNFISQQSGSFQINTGVMLMNFTRMLQADWRLYHEKDAPIVKYGVDLLLPYYRKFKDKAEHDQKLLNIMFHFNPDLLYQLPCSWNFKNNFCTDDKNVCEDAEKKGAGAVHGIAGAFFGDTNPTFKGLYETFSQYNMGDDVQKKLLKRYLAHLGAYATNTYCGKKSKIIIKPLKQSLEGIDFAKSEKEIK